MTEKLTANSIAHQIEGKCLVCNSKLVETYSTKFVCPETVRIDSRLWYHFFVGWNNKSDVWFIDPEFVLEWNFTTLMMRVFEFEKRNEQPYFEQESATLQDTIDMYKRLKSVSGLI